MKTGKRAAFAAPCALLALLLLLPAFLFACAKEPAANDSSSDVSFQGDGPLVPSLGEADYSGRVLRVLSSGEEKAYGKEPFAADESVSEPVNDAVIQRNDMLEQSYGFTVEAEFVDDLRERVGRDLVAGTETYDVVSSGLQTLALLSADGSFLDLYAIPDSHLDLTANWWDTASIEDMTVMDHLFFATGDILLLDDESTRCVFYNKDIARDNELDDMAQLVRDGKWTLDEMYAMAKKVAADGDDGVMNVTGNDTWGIVGAIFDSFYLVLGCGCPQVEKNENGEPELAMLNERNVNAFLKVFDILNDNSCVAYIEQYYSWNDPDASKVKGQFYDGKSLFLLSIINDVNSPVLRNASIRYGILPYPKYDEAQDTYATTVDPYDFACVSIPYTCEDTDFVTFALEALAYTSQKYVTPQYYDRTLKNKRFPDDDDSPEMLDILFSNRLVDISVAFNWDDCIQYYNNIMFGHTPEVQSYVEGRQSAFDAAKEKTLEALWNME